MRSFFSLTRELVCTTFVVSRNIPDTYGRFGIEEIWSDGVLRLDSAPSESGVKGTFLIIKMRDLPLLEQGKLYKMTITGIGIDILPK